MRPTKNKYYLDIAAEVAKRSTCLRRQYGAVIVKNDEIIATGYNGAARGEKNCCDTYSECPRASKPHNSGDYSDCPAVHAEMNAITSAARKDMIGATLYLAGWDNGERIKDATPCPICSRLIKNAGIDRIISNESQYDADPHRGIMRHHD